MHKYYELRMSLYVNIKFSGPLISRMCVEYQSKKTVKDANNHPNTNLWNFSSRIFHSYEDVTINDEGLQTMFSALHPWPLSRNGTLACHTFCDTGALFIWSYPRNYDIHICSRTFGSGTFNFFVNDLGLSQLGFKHPSFFLYGKGSNRLRQAIENVILTNKIYE